MLFNAHWQQRPVHGGDYKLCWERLLASSPSRSLDEPHRASVWAQRGAEWNKAARQPLGRPISWKRRPAAADCCRAAACCAQFVWRPAHQQKAARRPAALQVEHRGPRWPNKSISRRPKARRVAHFCSRPLTGPNAFQRARFAKLRSQACFSKLRSRRAPFAKTARSEQRGKQPPKLVCAGPIVC